EYTRSIPVRSPARNRGIGGWKWRRLVSRYDPRGRSEHCENLPRSEQDFPANRDSLVYEPIWRGPVASMAAVELVACERGGPNLYRRAWARRRMLGGGSRGGSFPDR